jgi:hypothetical protein
MFMRDSRKNHDRFGRPLGIFVNDFAQFGLYMGLQGLADVDLFSADLIAHDVSSARLLALVDGQRPSTKVLHKTVVVYAQSCKVAGPLDGRKAGTGQGGFRTH